MIDTSVIDTIPHIKNFLFSKILSTSKNLSDSFEATQNLSRQANLTETPKTANDAGINNNKIDHSEFC